MDASISLCLSIACFVFALFFVAHLAVNSRRVRYLRDYALPAEQTFPLVSIIVPARNEEREIERAVRSLLALDYPNYELLLVNDRSTDATGALLDHVAEEDPRLRVVHLTELPSGWLGKNHAMEFGARQARGELLLFTDADVVMQPSTLRRAVGYMTDEQLDHLTMAPECDMPTRLLEAFVVIFIIFFSAWVRPWKVRDPRSKAHVGVGAFNLVRTDVYQAIGTHEAIRMRPDDDLKFGKLVKLGGYKQDVVYGADYISVRWYTTLRELIDGLMKNAFSATDYRLSVIAMSAVMMLLFMVWPYIGVTVASGAARWFYCGAVACWSVLFISAAYSATLRWWLFPLFPLCVAMFVYIQWRATLLTFVNNGIRWRDTHYSLAELKANKV